MIIYMSNKNLFNPDFYYYNKNVIITVLTDEINVEYTIKTS